MLKISKIISSKSKNVVMKNSEYLGRFHFLKMKISKIINLFDKHVFKWPRYYGMHQK